MNIQQKKSSLVRQITNVFYSCLKDPFSPQIVTHAAALSFKSALSLVPVLALIFSVGKGFGVKNIIEPFIMKHFVGGEIANDIFPQVLAYVENTSVKALGTIGLIFILYTAISMISDIERAFNRIWSVKRARSFYRKFTDYLFILIVGPLFLSIMLSVSPLLSSHTITQKLMEYGLFAGAFGLFIKTMPWLASIIVITLLYLYIPNIKVKVRAALFAGVLAGMAWQLTQLLFIQFQIGVSRYNAIYGTFATVPIFLLWLQASWIIILAGAVLANACQNRSTTHNFSVETIPFGEREKLLFVVLVQVCKHYDAGEGQSSVNQLASELLLPEEVIREACDILIDMNYLVSLEDEEGNLAYIPEQPPASMNLADFFIDAKEPHRRDLLHFSEKILNRDMQEVLAARNEALTARFADTPITSTYKNDDKSAN